MSDTVYDTHGLQGTNVNQEPISVIEASRSTLHLVLDEVGPHKPNDARIVIAVSQVVVQRREAVPLACRLHRGKLFRFKLVCVDVSPIKR